MLPFSAESFFALWLAVPGRTMALSAICHTEALNSWDWKGPLEIVQSHPSAEGPPRANCIGSHLDWIKKCLDQLIKVSESPGFQNSSPVLIPTHSDNNCLHVQADRLTLEQQLGTAGTHTAAFAGELLCFNAVLACLVEE